MFHGRREAFVTLDKPFNFLGINKSMVVSLSNERFERYFSVTTASVTELPSCPLQPACTSHTPHSTHTPLTHTHTSHTHDTHVSLTHVSHTHVSHTHVSLTYMSLTHVSLTHSLDCSELKSLFPSCGVGCLGFSM